MWWSGYPESHWFFGPWLGILCMAFCAAMMFMMMGGMMGGHGSPSKALDILKERFARGEITEAQYEQQKRLLKV